MSVWKTATDVRTVLRGNFRSPKRKIFEMEVLLNSRSPPLSAVVHFWFPPPSIGPDVFDGWPLIRTHNMLRNIRCWLCENILYYATEKRILRFLFQLNDVASCQVAAHTLTMFCERIDLILVKLPELPRKIVEVRRVMRDVLMSYSVLFDVCFLFSSCFWFDSTIHLQSWFTILVCTYLPFPVIVFCFLRLSSYIANKVLSINLSLTHFLSFATTVAKENGDYLVLSPQLWRTIFLFYDRRLLRWCLMHHHTTPHVRTIWTNGISITKIKCIVKSGIIYDDSIQS